MDGSIKFYGDQNQASDAKYKNISEDVDLSYGYKQTDRHLLLYHITWLHM